MATLPQFAVSDALSPLDPPQLAVDQTFEQFVCAHAEPGSQEQDAGGNHREVTKPQIVAAVVVVVDDEVTVQCCLRNTELLDLLVHLLQQVDGFNFFAAFIVEVCTQRDGECWNLSGWWVEEWGRSEESY